MVLQSPFVSKSQGQAVNKYFAFGRSVLNVEEVGLRVQEDQTGFARHFLRC